MSKKESYGLGSGIAENVELLKSWLAKVIQEEALLYLETADFQERVNTLEKGIKGKKTAVKVTEVAPSKSVLRLPEGEFFYFDGKGYRKMTSIEVESKESYRQLCIPFSFKGGETFHLIAGKEANFATSEHKPEFYTTLDPSMLRLVRLGYRFSDNKRYVVYMNYTSRNEVPFTSESIEKGIFKIVAEEALSTGEYAFLVTGEKVKAFDFDIR